MKKIISKKKKFETLLLPIGTSKKKIKVNQKKKPEDNHKFNKKKINILLSWIDKTCLIV